MHPGGLGADEQDLGDLGVGAAGRDLEQDLALAVSEAEAGQFARRARGPGRLLPRRLIPGRARRRAVVQRQPGAAGQGRGLLGDRGGTQPRGDRVCLPDGLPGGGAVPGGEQRLGVPKQAVTDQVGSAQVPPDSQRGGPGPRGV